MTATPTPPRARREPVAHTLHGDTRTDDYAWLRADNWREALTDPSRLAPEIRDYLRAENDYTEALMAPTAALRKELYDEMRGRIPGDDMSVPDEDGDYAYYTRQVEGGEYGVYCRHPRGAPDAEEILLDINAEAKGKAYFHVGAVCHSPDHRYIACCIDTQGAEFYRLEVRDAQTGKVVGEPIERVQSDVEWAADSRRLVYVSLDDEHRADKVWLRAVGAPAGQAQALYAQDAPNFFVSLHKTRSKNFIVISSHDHTSTEAYLVSAERPDDGASLVSAREADLEYEVEEKGGQLFILTNADGCTDYKIVTAPVATPGRAHWRDWLTPPAGVMLEGLIVAKNFVAHVERANGLPRLVVTRGGVAHALAFEQAAYEVGIVPTAAYADDNLRFEFTSPVTPREVYDYDTAMRERTLRKAQVVPSGHDPSAYRVERLTATAADGEKVPITLLRPARAAAADDDGRPAPTLVYGYGAYGHTLPARFSPMRLSLVDRGFAYALAHVRGGKDKGDAWYRAGKLAQKENTISDFIAVLERLCECGVSQPGRIAIQGASAGGILVGAVANRRPDLLRAVIADVPFVDVLNTMCDADLPLTPPEWLEWGNPIEDAAAYQTIKAYSPYDNVKRGAYPDMLVTASVSDPRVTYWEPAKWVARLRALRTDDGALLLKTNLEAGHAGASGRYEFLHEVAFTYAFLLRAFGGEAGAA